MANLPPTSVFSSNTLLSSVLSLGLGPRLASPKHSRTKLTQHPHPSTQILNIMSLARSLSLTLIHRYPSESHSLRQPSSSRPKRRASWPPIGRGEGYRCSPLRNEVKLEELQRQAEQDEEDEEELEGVWGGAYEGGEALCRVETRDERFPPRGDGNEQGGEGEEECDIDRAEYLGGFSLCRVQTRTSDVYDHPYYGYDVDSDEEAGDDLSEVADDEDVGVDLDAEVEDSPELDDSHASDDSDEHDYDFDGDLDAQYEEDMRGWVGGEGDEDVSIHTGEEEDSAVAVAVTQPRMHKGKGRASSSESEVAVAEATTALEVLLYCGGMELSRVKTRDEREGKVSSKGARLEAEAERFEDAVEP